MLFLITVSVLLASAQAKYYTDCGSKLATVDRLVISGCQDDESECILRRNTDVSIALDFTSSVDSNSVEAVAHGIVMDYIVPFPLPHPDACKDSGLTCPIKAGAKESYATSMPVLSSYPSVQLDIKWEMKNDKDEDLICLLVAARID